jgi:hypothetical protein
LRRRREAGSPAQGQTELGCTFGRANGASRRCRGRRHTQVAPAARSRPREAPEVLLGDRDAAARWIEGGSGARVSGDGAQGLSGG